MNPQTIPVRPFMYAGFEVAVVRRKSDLSDVSDWSVDRTARQLELGMNVPRRLSRSCRPRARASAWFNRMRAAVEGAEDLTQRPQRL